jgi:hypothetical protein
MQAVSDCARRRTGLHQALDRTASRPGSQRLRGREGARRPNTQAHSDPLRAGTARGPGSLMQPWASKLRRRRDERSWRILKEGREQNGECRKAGQSRPKPLKSQRQARCKPGDWEVLLCVSLLFLYWCSIGALLVLYWCSVDAWVLPPSLRQLCAVSTAHRPGFDRAGLAVIPMKSNSSIKV